MKPRLAYRVAGGLFALTAAWSAFDGDYAMMAAFASIAVVFLAIDVQD